MENFIKSHFIQAVLFCFSGGTDSLVSTHLAWRLTENIKIPLRSLIRKVVHVNTTVGLPGILDYVKEVANKFNWDLEILQPKVSFWKLAEKWGMPTLRRRWCCFRLKLEPLFNYALTLPVSRVCFVTGMRREESPRRKDMPQTYRRRWKRLVLWNYHPIVNWSDKGVENYIKQHNLPVNPVKKILGHSGECICGVYAGRKELLKLRAHFPEFIRKFEKLEKVWPKSSYTFYASGKRWRVEDLFKQKILDEYIK